MKLPAPSQGGGQDFEICPAGTYQGAIAYIEDIGLQEKTWEGETKVEPQIIIGFELNKKREDGSRHLLSKRLKLSTHEKSTLRKWLGNIKGRDLTDQEISGLDTDKLIGKNCMVSVVHNEWKGKTSAKISGVMQLIEGMEAMELSGQPVPEWIAKVKAEAKQPLGAEPEAAGNDEPDDEGPF